MRLALGIHGLDRGRTRAIVLAGLGHVQLEQGDTGRALATWQAFLDCATGVRSVRVDNGPAGITARLRSVPAGPAAQALRERIAGLG
nr:hypothetical protein [Streptomyces sp. SID5468]